jgi:hypothetical protein
MLRRLEDFSKIGPYAKLLVPQNIDRQNSRGGARGDERGGDADGQGGGSDPHDVEGAGLRGDGVIITEYTFSYAIRMRGFHLQDGAGVAYSYPRDLLHRSTLLSLGPPTPQVRNSVQRHLQRQHWDCE